MNGRTLSIEDISRMSEQQLVELYRQGYTLEGAIQKSGCQSCAAPGNVHALAGTCSGTITIAVPCTPNWQIGAWGPCQSNGTQTRTVTDLNNCGTNAGKPATTQVCTYGVEAVLISCGVPYPAVGVSGDPIPPGSSFYIPIVVQSPNVAGIYRVDLTISDYSTIISSPTFTISAGTGNIGVTVAFTTLPADVPTGSKGYTIALVKT